MIYAVFVMGAGLGAAVALWCRRSRRRPNTSEYGESHLASGWEQNSFVTPLDSRAGKL